MPPMFGRIAYVISIGGTALTLVLRIVIGADDTLTFGLAALTILGLAYTLGHATGPARPGWPGRASAAS